MTDSRNVVHPLERASYLHSDHNTENRGEKLKKYKRKSRVKYRIEKKDANFEPNGQNDMLT